MKYLIAFLTILSLNSCKKVEGPGGTSTIKGKITINNYNSQGTVLEGTYAGADQDIYIIYGDKDSTFDNDVKSSIDGTFEFPFLENGKYAIYVYEDVLPIVVGGNTKKAVLVSTEIMKRKSTIDLGEIIIKKK
ncbi:MAG: hypothetical protein HYR91_04680 [Flavobacteriia bacterium]|nr:hypothetical protein [Flavobacteriia bacterium]